MEDVASAQAIGHEKIDTFAPVTTSRVRLNILSSSREPHIRNFKSIATHRRISKARSAVMYGLKPVPLLNTVYGSGRVQGSGPRSLLKTRIAHLKVNTTESTHPLS